MKYFNVVKFIFVLLFAGLLISCAAQPKDPSYMNTNFNMSTNINDKAVVILATRYETNGLFFRNSYAVFATWQNATKSNRLGSDAPGILLKTTGTIPRFYTIDPGTYFLTQWETEPIRSGMSHTQRVSVPKFGDQILTPKFTVRAGDVLHLGRLTITTGRNNTAHYAVIDDEKEVNRWIWYYEKYKPLKSRVKKQFMTIARLRVQS